MILLRLANLHGLELMVGVLHSFITKRGIHSISMLKKVARSWDHCCHIKVGIPSSCVSRRPMLPSDMPEEHVPSGLCLGLLMPAKN